MPKNLYIGDLHIGDPDIIWLDNRPFRCTSEMWGALKANWEHAVSQDDTVYVLGDMFGDGDLDEQSRMLCSLPGMKILVRGNHDKKVPDGFAAVKDFLEIRDGKDTVVLSHYPMVAYPGFYDGAAHLYSHVHDGYEYRLADRARALLEGLYRKPCRMYNAGCMMPWMGYAPRTLEEIEKGSRKCALNQAYGAAAFHPEIQSMLTLSTAHVSGGTAEKLEREPDLNAMCLSVYPKCGSRSPGSEDYGWYVYLPEKGPMPGVPEDLARCIGRARALGCQVLCLDSDGPVDGSLATYDW